MNVENGRSIAVLVAGHHPSFGEASSEIINHEPTCAWVAEASDGIEAETRYKECRPDVVLVDLAMPELEGVEVTGH